jgi:3-oxoacid CoA-transferase subunit B
VVSRVITELAVLEIAGGAFEVVELAAGVTLAELREATDADVRG